MPAKITEQEANERKLKILEAARWCFLNFGFSKTSLDDISRRAEISRTLLYRTFKDKEDIFAGVFAHWLIGRHPQASQVARGRGTAFDRLFAVCRLLLIEPWIEIAGAPMSVEFYEVCDRVTPEARARHRRVFGECAVAILGDSKVTEVLLLCLEGLLTDRPTKKLLEQRVHILVDQFVKASRSKAR